MSYAKFVLAIVATGVSAALAALTGDNFIDAQEWMNVIVLMCGAFSVLYVENSLNAPVAKTVVTVMAAVATVAGTFVLNGVDATGIMQMVLAGLTAVGVYAIPNTQRAVA